MHVSQKTGLAVGTLALLLCAPFALAQSETANAASGQTPQAQTQAQAQALPQAHTQLTPLQKAAQKLSDDLDQALSQSNFDALARQSIREQAAVLVEAANQLAAGEHPKNKDVHRAEKKLMKAFDTGLFEVEQTGQLNLDMANYQDAAKPHKKHHWGL